MMMMRIEIMMMKQRVKFPKSSKILLKIQKLIK